MKKWNDKTKKIALVVALIVVGAGAFCGIRFTLKTDTPVEVAVENLVITEDDEDLIINAESENLTEQDTEELAISTKPIDSVKTSEADDTTQSIQNDPVKTEEIKPSEPPAEVTETEQSSFSEKPENKEIPANSSDTSSNSGSSGTGTSSNPRNGEVRDGKIYIEGFGWLDYEGGGTTGTQAGDIYENGNTIGIMD